MKAYATYGRARSLSLAVTVALLAAACTSNAPIPTSGSTPGATSGSPAATTPALSSGPAGPSLAGPSPVGSGPAATDGSGSPVPNGQPLAESRQELIAQALAEGRIDEVTSLLYRGYALFGMPQLPAEFAGAPSRGDDSALFEEILEALPDLSAADQARLSPFVGRPTDPGSVFAAGTFPTVAHVTKAAFELAADTQPADVICHAWADSGSTSEHFKVWACVGSDAASASRDAANVATLMESLWVPMTAAVPAGMGPPIPDVVGANVALGGDPRIDVYELSSGEAVYRGGTQGIPAKGIAAAVSSPPFNDASGASLRTSSGFMLVNRARVADQVQMRQDLIHEFFHILQKAHNRVAPFKGNVQHWFGEASATWAETYYSPATSGQVHTWFSSVFQLSHEGLESTVPDHDYAAYIWPFFMAQEAGPAAVFQAWAGIEAAAPGDFKAVSDAIDAQLPFDAHFRDFAVRNLNRELIPSDPVLLRYLDADPNFPDGDSPVPIESGELGTKVTYRSPNQSIQPLAASYFYLIPDADVRDVTFDLTPLSPNAKLDGDVLLHIAGSWQRRKIDGNLLHLCLDDPADAFDQAHLILSNHGREASDKITGQFEIRSKTSCNTGHYSIDVSNVGAGQHIGPGHYESDGGIACVRTSDGVWGGSAVYFPNHPVDPEKDVGAIEISTTPGNLWVAVSLAQDKTDDVWTWSVMPQFGNGVITFSVNDKGRPVTISAVADDVSQHIKITVTCSVLVIAP